MKLKYIISVLICALVGICVYSFIPIGYYLKWKHLASKHFADALATTIFDDKSYFDKQCDEIVDILKESSEKDIEYFIKGYNHQLKSMFVEQMKAVNYQMKGVAIPPEIAEEMVDVYCDMFRQAVLANHSSPKNGNAILGTPSSTSPSMSQ